MARRVFFSFHFERDIFRANQVRNMNVAFGADTSGYFDHSEYESAKRRGSDAIRKMIDSHLSGTSVTVVLIGSETASRDWVRYDIDQSIARNNGLVGIRIHQLKNIDGTSDLPGPIPVVPLGVHFPVYDWLHNPGWFSQIVEEAGRRSDLARLLRPF